MKKLYLLLFVLLGFIACEQNNSGYTKTVEKIYFCNKLPNEVNINLFKGDEVFKYKMEPNETIYFTTIRSSYGEFGLSNSYHFPPYTDRNNYLLSFDSATVTYNSLIYTFTNNMDLYYSPNNTSVLYLAAAYSSQIESVGELSKIKRSYRIYNTEYFNSLDRKIKDLPTNFPF